MTGTNRTARPAGDHTMHTMLWTLWRAILIEFWRLLILSICVLVTVVAFAATVKPLADGKLTADQAIRFMLYAIPPMLSYTLPFAGGFAATLTYHRFTAENEITAAHAGGVSHKRLLFPALASGMILAAGLWGLNDRVIPHFLVRMEEMITRDFARLMVNSLRQGESATIAGTEIHADQVDQVAPEDGSPVRQQFLLTGVAMVETNSRGDVVIDGTARHAWIQILPVWALNATDRTRIGDDAESAVVLKFIDVTIYRNGAPQSADPLVPPAIAIPNMFQDDPKFLTGTQLRELLKDPDRMSFVDRKRVALARMMAAGESYSGFGSTLTGGRPVAFTAPDGSSVRVLGSTVGTAGSAWRVEPLRESGRVEVEVARSDGRTTDRLTATQATLTLQLSGGDDPLASSAVSGTASRYELTLTGVRVLADRTGEGATDLAATSYRDLSPLDDPMPGYLAMPSAELLAVARSAPPGTAIRVEADGLAEEIAHLEREILSKSQERWALSVSCLVMVLLGAVMAMRLKDATPLVVYLWSFFPALVSVIVTESGQQATHTHGVWGLPLLWAGVVGLGYLLVFTFRRMARL